MERNKRSKISAAFFAILFLFSCGETKVKETKAGDTPSVQSGQSAEPIVVLELFSSEGCGDCPDAEAIIK
jgi:hypothetical protein